MTDNQILELHKQGLSLRQIARKVGLSHIAVRKKIIKLKNLSKPEVSIDVATAKRELDSMIAATRLITDKEERISNLKVIMKKVEHYKNLGIKLAGYSLRSIQRKMATGKIERKKRQEQKQYRNKTLSSNTTLEKILMLACKFYFKAAGSGRKGRGGKRISGNLLLTTDLILKYAKENEDFWEIAAIPRTTLYRTLQKEFTKLSSREHHQYLNHFNLWKKNKIRVPGAFTDHVNFGDWIVGDDHRSDIDKVLVWNKTRRVYEKKSIIGWYWKELKTQKVLSYLLVTSDGLTAEHLVLSLIEALQKFGRPAKGILIDNGLGKSQRFVEFCNKLGLAIKFSKPYEPTDKSPAERAFGYIKNEHDVFQANFTGSNHPEEGRHPTAALSAPQPEVTFEQYKKSLENYLFGFYETRERRKVIDGKRIRISIRDLFNSYWKNWNKNQISDTVLRYAYSCNDVKKFDNNRISLIRNGEVYYYTPKDALPPAFNNRKYIIAYMPNDYSKIDLYATTNIVDSITGWQVAKGEYVTTLYNLRELPNEEKLLRVNKLNHQINKYHKQIAKVIAEKTALVNDVEFNSVIGANGKVSGELRKKERKIKQLIENAMPIEKIEEVIASSQAVSKTNEITEADWAELDKLVQ